MTIDVVDWISGAFAIGFLVPCIIASAALGIALFIALDVALGRIYRRLKNRLWRWAGK